MKALVCRALGPVSGLTVEDYPEPELEPGHLLIANTIAGANFPDGLVIEGKHVFKPQPPFVPGAEAAGRVIAVGEGVNGFAIGDRVVSFAITGGFGERRIAPADTSYRIPANVPDELAAAAMITHGTAYHALKDRARLKPGETVLVLGAGGGTGLAAVEVARAMGARVVAAASSAEKLALAKECGAEALINYSEEDLKEAMRGRIGIPNVDVVYDPIGGPFAEPATRLLAWQGRYLVIGFANGEIPRLPVNLFLVKSADLLGVLWGAAAAADPKTHQANMAQLFAWIGEGMIRPRVTARYPLERTADALTAVMNRKVTGKVVIEITHA
jgi:NADPH2:quinone reductase